MAHTEAEHQYWSRTALTYDSATRFATGAATQRAVCDWLRNQITSSDRVLELGCGTGIFSEVIAHQAKHLVAVDRSDEMLALARTRLRTFDNTTVSNENCYGLSFDDGAFDTVFLGNLLHIVSAPSQILTEAYRVVRRQGTVVVVDATASGLAPLSKLGMALRYLKAFGLPPRTNKSLRPDALTTLVRKAGFDISTSMVIERETRAICITGQKP